MVAWNCTNPDAVVKGEKPALRLVGPLTYREVRDKWDFGYG